MPAENKSEARKQELNKTIDGFSLFDDDFMSVVFDRNIEVEEKKMENIDEEIKKKVDEIFKAERWRWHTSGKVEGGLAVLAILGLEKEERKKYWQKHLN